MKVKCSQCKEKYEAKPHEIRNDELCPQCVAILFPKENTTVHCDVSGNQSISDIQMEQKNNQENENPPIKWGKAYLYAFGWLIGWSIISIPFIPYFIFSGKHAIGLVMSIIIVTFMMGISKYVHHSRRVPIALLIEIVIVAGSLTLIFFHSLTSGHGAWG